MSEFSESLHLRSDDAAAAFGLLAAAKVAGYVTAPANGWVSFVFESDEPPGRDRFDRILAANRGLLVFWDYAEDHGCNVTVYEGSRRVGRLKVSFESARSSFDREVFLEKKLLTPAGADAVTQWLAHAVPAYTAGEALGLPHFKWLSFDIVRKARANMAEKTKGEAGEAVYTDAIEVDAAGRVRTNEAPLALGQSPTTNRWDVLAQTVLKKWVAAGAIELEEGESLTSLADALSDVLAEEPSPDVIEDFLLDRPEVAEVFATGAELVRSVR